MQDKIILFFNHHDSLKLNWVKFSSQKDTVWVENGELSELATVSKAEIVVVLPDEDVSLLLIELPQLARSRLMPTLAYALEEQVIGEPENLHFALGEHPIQNQWPVAVVSHEKMQQWQTLLKSVPLEANRFLPLGLALPWEENHWHIVILDHVIIRTGKCQTITCDKTNFHEFLTFAITASDLPHTITIHHVEEIPAFSHPSISIVYQKKTPQELYTMLATECVQVDILNLLQGKYVSKKPDYSKNKKLDKLLSYLILFWISILVVYPTLSFILLKQRQSHINAEIASIYYRQFPQATHVVAPLVRLQDKLQKLTGDTNHQTALILMAHLGKSKEHFQSMNIKRLNFQSNQLEVELTLPTSEEFNQLTDFLSQEGLNVKQQNANLIDGRLNAIINLALLS